MSLKPLSNTEVKGGGGGERGGVEGGEQFGHTRIYIFSRNSP